MDSHLQDTVGLYGVIFTSNAKREYHSRGVVYNGSHGWVARTLRDYLYSLRGRMRVSVYKEPGVKLPHSHWGPEIGFG